MPAGVMIIRLIRLTRQNVELLPDRAIYRHPLKQRFSDLPLSPVSGRP
jgi:hypothetical protein